MQWTRAGTTLCACTVLLLSAGCNTYVQRGSTLYHEGHYVEAAEVFERTEQRLPSAKTRECAEYGLYRGLTLLALGDFRNAHRWLSYAYEVERTGPGTLQAHQRAMLDRGWNDLNRRLVDATQPPLQGPNEAVAGQPGTPLAGSETLPTTPAIRSFTQ